VNEFWNWIVNLCTGVLGSIIASVIVALFVGWAIVRKIRRKSKLVIKGSTVKGDVVGGNKVSVQSQNKPFTERRNSHISVVESEIGGDIVVGDKEK
jgi:hypothetical protein